MEATLKMDYEVERNPEPEEIGILMVHTTFVRPVDMDLILNRSRFSSSVPTRDFINDVYGRRIEEIYYIEEIYCFLTEAGVHGRDAFKLIESLIDLTVEVIRSDEYRPRYALSVWLTLEVAPLCNQTDLETQEAVRGSLEDYERNTWTRPASKFVVESLSKRRYERSSSIVDRCTICLDEFDTGKVVVKLDCGHEFNDDCIVKWFKFNHVCPLCRHEFECEDDDFLQNKKVLS